MGDGYVNKRMVRLVAGLLLYCWLLAVCVTAHSLHVMTVLPVCVPFLVQVAKMAFFASR
jgi:hypothetical protein